MPENPPNPSPARGCGNSCGPGTAGEMTGLVVPVAVRMKLVVPVPSCEGIDKDPFLGHCCGEADGTTTLDVATLDTE